MFKGASLRGIFVGRSGREPFAALLRAITQNGIEPVIDKVFPFADAPAAYAHLASASHLGKVVINLVSDT
jgi:NADPH:quinone reductase-like Zn-dependent oxidoreductase